MLVDVGYVDTMNCGNITKAQYIVVVITFKNILLLYEKQSLDLKL